MIGWLALELSLCLSKGPRRDQQGRVRFVLKFLLKVLRIRVGVWVLLNYAISCILVLRPLGKEQFNGYVD